MRRRFRFPLDFGDGLTPTGGERWYYPLWLRALAARRGISPKSLRRILRGRA